MITIIVLWILLGIIAVIVILLHFSITAQIDLNKKGFDLRVRYMFFDIYPRKPKKKKQKRSKKLNCLRIVLMILRSLRTILKKAYLSHRLMIRLIKQEKCPSKLLKLSLKNRKE